MPAQAWVTLVVGFVATVGVLITWQQKNRADRRGDWWERITWAYERTFSENEDEQTLGWTMLAVLVGSPLATRDDSDIVQVIAEDAALALAGEDVQADDQQQQLSPQSPEGHDLDDTAESRLMEGEGTERDPDPEPQGG